jgi:hypothetical protein
MVSLTRSEDDKNRDQNERGRIKRAPIDGDEVQFLSHEREEATHPNMIHIHMKGTDLGRGVPTIDVNDATQYWRCKDGREQDP